MTTYLVTCKKKHSLFERIESIGCVDTTSNEQVRFNEDEAIRLIEGSMARFLVRDHRGHEAFVEVEEREGRKFLITRPDRYITDNLLALPECSSKPVVVQMSYKPVVAARSHGVHRR